MVSRKTQKSKTLKRKRNFPVFFVSFIFLLVTIFITLVVIVYLIISHFTKPDTSIEQTEITDIEDTSKQVEDQPTKSNEKTLINFQSIIDDWVYQTGGTRSVIIYDLDNDKTVGEYNAEQIYNTASLYKLFVVYTGYRKIESGEWSENDLAGTKSKTIIECLDLSIRESNSACAETLWQKIGYNSLNDIVENDYKTLNTNVKNLTSTPSDITNMMKIYYRHQDIKREDLVKRMKDSFLNQPATEYNWRQGLPSGFAKAKVYNKVGWAYNAKKKYWDVYHDAAIVEFPEKDRHYIVVAMTNRVPYQQITKLGTSIENYFYRQ